MNKLLSMLFILILLFFFTSPDLIAEPNKNKSLTERWLAEADDDEASWEASEDDYEDDAELPEEVRKESRPLTDYDTTGKVSVGVSFGISKILGEADFDNQFFKQKVSVRSDSDSEVGFSAELNLRYGIMDWLSAGMNFNYRNGRLTNLNIDFQAAGLIVPVFGDDVGTVHAFSFVPVVEVRVPASWTGIISPFLYAGVGVAVFTVDEKNLPGVDLEFDPTFTVEVGGGFDIFLTPEFAFSAEVKWAYTNPNFQFDDAGLEGTWDLSDIRGLFGFKYYF